MVQLMYNRGCFSINFRREIRTILIYKSNRKSHYSDKTKDYQYYRMMIKRKNFFENSSHYHLSVLPQSSRFFVIIILIRIIYCQHDPLCSIAVLDLK